MNRILNNRIGRKSQHGTVHSYQKSGSPKEVAAVAFYLSTEDSAFMIGAELLLDGGLRSL